MLIFAMLKKKNSYDSKNYTDFAKEELDIDDIKEWIVECRIPHIHADKLLKILQRRVLPSLPKTTETLLQKIIKTNIEAMKADDGTNAKYTYLGIGKGLEEMDLSNHVTKILELIFNIDGLSPFKSSSLQIWPTLCKVY